VAGWLRPLWYRISLVTSAAEQGAGGLPRQRTPANELLPKNRCHRTAAIDVQPQELFHRTSATERRPARCASEREPVSRRDREIDRDNPPKSPPIAGECWRMPANGIERIIPPSNRCRSRPTPAKRRRLRPYGSKRRRTPPEPIQPPSKRVQTAPIRRQRPRKPDRTGQKRRRLRPKGAQDRRRRPKPATVRRIPAESSQAGSDRQEESLGLRISYRYGLI
jgi:hypothetical protein